jgi:hypothetical protein
MKLNNEKEITMGRQDYSRTAYGMTEREALNSAIEDADMEVGHQEGYSGDINSRTTMKSKRIKKPKPAKSCNVTKEIQKGTRKWETRFVIRHAYENREYGYAKTQGDALKKAKEISLEKHVTLEISIEKVLVGGTYRIARVSPKKSEMGEWRFWGKARC